MRRINILNNHPLVDPYFVNRSQFINITHVMYIWLLLLSYSVVEIVTVVLLAIYYSINFIDVLCMLDRAIYDICIILPSGMSINILFIYVLTYLNEYNIYLYICQWLEILLLIVTEIFRYTWKVIVGSIKFRLIIGIIMLSLSWIGLDKNLIYYIIISYMVFILVVSTYKSNNKFKQLCKLFMNLAIVYTFWHNIEDLNSINIIILLMHNNMILTFDEWDFDFEIDLSEAINSLNLHGCSIGDPSVIPPIPPKFKHLVHDSNDADTDNTYETSEKKYPDPRLFSSWKMHMAWEDNYRNFILVNGVIYYTDDLQDALESKPDIKETDMLEEKKFIIDCAAKKSHIWTPRYEGQSIEEHKKELEWRIYQFNFEYNTLVKANTYYVQKGLDTEGNPLDHTYKDAAEGWQKRQISMWSETYTVIHNLQAQNPFQISNTLCAKNYFDDMVAYKEVRENLFWIKLFLIQADYVLKSLQAENKNDYTVGEYDVKIESLNKDCYDRHKIAYSVFKHYEEWRIKNSPNPLVDEAFKKKVHEAFLEEAKTE